jgi:hypothetical protein
MKRYAGMFLQDRKDLTPYKQDYPFGAYTTIFLKLNYGCLVHEWTADKDKIIKLEIESCIDNRWVHTNFKYDNINDMLEVTSCLIHSFFPAGSAAPDSVLIEIYDQSGVLVKILPSDEADEKGVFRLDWINTGLRSNTIYRAKTVITAFGKTFIGDIEQEIRVPVKRPVATDSGGGKDKK